MRVFVPLLSFVLFINIAWAQNSHEEIEYNPFGVPEQILKVITPEQLDIVKKDGDVKPFPKCSDPLLISKIQKILNDDNLNIEVESVVQKRARILAAKNMATFSSVDVANFNPKTNRDVANMMITAKINQGLSNDDFAICVGDNPILKRRVYLLMQRKDSEITVFIVNYRTAVTPSFIFN